MSHMGRWLILAGAVSLASMACSGSGCSKLEALPAGFPSAERTPNAVQMRVSATGFDKIEANPAGFAQQLIGPSLQLGVPPSCGGNPSVCCPGGIPSASCGPIQFDAAPKPGDDPRLVLVPVQAASRVDVTLRVRAQTVADIPFTVSGANCFLKVNTAPGPYPDLQLNVPISHVQDATTGTTRFEVGSVAISRLTSDDVSVTGGLSCSIASLGLSFFLGTLTSTLADGITQQLRDSLCKKCPSGVAATCGPLATACSAGVCKIEDRCLQEIGASGRVLARALFGGAPPGSAGALDLYEVAGGYATTNSAGAALGILGGLLPAGTAHDLCGPSAPAPAPVPMPASAFFQGNTRPDTGQPFDVALGLHASHAQRFLHAAYQGGVLCPTLDTRSLPNLTSDALLTIAPSLDNSTRGDRPVWLGFRPQSPPVLSLGANTFTAAGAVDQPLATLAFSQAEMDVFAQVERQPIRIATVVGDMAIPLGARSDVAGQVRLVAGTLTPPVNVSIENSAALLETPSALATLAPLLQGVLVPEMIDRVGPLTLPQVAGLAIAPSAITTVDNQGFVALFGNLVSPPSGSGAAPFGDAPRAPIPRGRAPLELLLTLFTFALLVLLLSTRRRTAAATLLCVGLGVSAAPVACGGDDETSGAKQPGDAQLADSESDADAQGDAADADAALDAGADGSADASPCVPAPCQSGALEPALGAWNAVARGPRTVILTYDSKFGDAVLVELTGSTQTKTAIDGVPGVPPTHDPAGYRGGVEAPGADVGAWPSVALAGDRARAVYQDRDRGALVFALEDAAGGIAVHDIDDPASAGVEAGAFASIALGATPAVAYLVKGIPGANGVRNTELRFARAKSANPSNVSDWVTSVVATAPGTCAGLCGTDVCVAPSTAGDSEHCATPTTDCSSACGKGEACVSGSCRTLVPNALADLPRGTGLFARLLALGDGRFVIVHYDSVQSALVAQVETASGSSQFTAVVLDGAGADDRGMWSAAVVDGSDQVHVAYTDALRHQVLALSFTPGNPPGAPVVVDDGMRSGDRPHWVGAGLTAWLDGSSFRIAYQDAMTADVVVATRTAGVWSHSDLVTGAPLDGFALAAPASGAGPLVWDQLDPKDAKSHALTISANP